MRIYVDTDPSGVVLRWSTSPSPFNTIPVDTDLDPLAGIYLHEGEAHRLPEKPVGYPSHFDPVAGEWVDDRTPEDIAAEQVAAFQAAKAKAVADVNRACGAIRGMFVTQIPGQEMIYKEKEAESIAYLAQDPPPSDLSSYPFIAAEVGSTGQTAHDVATVYVTQAHMFRMIGSALEAIRIPALVGVEGATTPEDLQAVMNSFATTLQQFQDAL